MIKKILIPALVLAAASAAAPAAAQSYGGQYYGNQQRDPTYGQPYLNNNYGGWQGINQRQINLDRRIDRGLRNGTLSRREAVRLRSEFNAILRLEAGYRRGGLTR